MRDVRFHRHLAVRFREKVDTSAGEGGCWPWTGAKMAFGYGSIGVNRRTVAAHRVAFFLAHGHWPSGDTMHSCDNPPCVNPAHLSEGTRKENMAQCSERGRARGSAPKISEEQSAALVRRVLAGEKQSDLALEYGLDPKSVTYRIKRAHGGRLPWQS